MPRTTPKTSHTGRGTARRAVLILGLVAVAAVLLATGGALSAPVVGTNVLYTTDADFDQGTLVNVNHNAPNNNQLQLNTSSGTFPFIWIALSQRCTIAKINTTTGVILGEYRTISDDMFCAESSRTTVGIDGSVWVGHRGWGGVNHVGLAELNQCLDRNGNGTIETSTGYGDVLAWPGADSNVASAADECILHHVNTHLAPYNMADSRHMSIDANNKLWVGDWSGGHQFVRIDGTTGTVETAVRAHGCGGYGGLIDSNGVIWSSDSGFSFLRWDPDTADNATNPRCMSLPIYGYGVAIDSSGWVWINEFGSQVIKVSPDGNTTLGPFFNGSGTGASQGLAVDSEGDVWISSGLFCSSGCTIGHLKNDGTFVGNVSTPTGSGSTGVAVDAAGKIWAANRQSNTATRIDPNLGPLGCGGTGCADGTTRVGEVDLTVTFPATSGRPLPYPYNYSDMTGAQLFNSTAPQGTWTVTQDGGAAGTNWGTITWNTEPQGNVPAGASITVEARAADTEAALGSQAYTAVSNGTAFSKSGRFIQVRVTLEPNSAGASPVLSDIRIQTTGGPAPKAGWMSGEGRLTEGTKRLDYAFIVDCDPAKTPNFKGKLGSQNLNVTDITANTCTDDPTQEPAKPGAQFDTMEGTGTGTLGATSVLVEYKFVDGGLDNTDDSARIVIRRASDNVVLFQSQAQPIPPYGGGTRLGRNTANPPVSNSA